MPIWWGKVSCKDDLVLDYSKFYKNNFEKSLRNHLLSFIVSSPSCWYSFFLDAPIMVPAIAKAALY